MNRARLKRVGLMHHHPRPSAKPLACFRKHAIAAVNERKPAGFDSHREIRKRMYGFRKAPPHRCELEYCTLRHRPVLDRKLKAASKRAVTKLEQLSHLLQHRRLTHNG